VEQETNQFLGEEPIGKLMQKYAISCIISLLVGVLYNMIRKYGALDPVFGQEQYAQIPMAVVGIVMKFFQIVISIVVGMAAGCIPVVGFNMEAGKKDRIKELFTKLLIAEATVGFALLLQVFFGLDGVLYSMPLSDILTFIIAIILIIKTYKQLGGENHA